MTKTFKKSPIDIEKQILLLKSRGMDITDINHAKIFLKYCSYYRFCGLALHFENFDINDNRTHNYKIGTTLKQVEYIYNFDRELRAIIFKYTSLIEVSFRAMFSNLTALYYNKAHWYLNRQYFNNHEEHYKFKELCKNEFKRSRELFAISYRKNYENPKLPPIWMLTELMPFATWSKLYQNLKDPKLKKIISKEQQIVEKYLISWLQAIVVLRNCCAHHSRIWNRNFYLSPLISPQIAKKIENINYRKISVLLLIIYDFLKNNENKDYFKKEILDLINKYPNIELKYIGITGAIEDFFV